MTFPHEDGNGRRSYWIDTTPSTFHEPLEGDEEADVVVVGAGIVGLTAAYLLAKAGHSVVVVDRERLGMAETGHTTAHLQVVLDTRLSDLVPRFGMEGAKLAWDSQLEAIRLIESIAEEERIRCDLKRLDAYLFSPDKSDAKMLRQEVRLARRMGYAAEMADPKDVPFPCAAAVRFPDQGKFHVRKYLLGLAEAAQRHGARIYEGTEIADIESGEPFARARTREGHAVSGKWMLSCANVPFDVRVKLHSKLMSYRTYVIGARVPRGTFKDALYWDTLDPYHYVRVENQGEKDLVILGGEDHKVGVETQTAKHYGALEEFLRNAASDMEVAYRWSGEVIETADDLPYIGHIPGLGPNELVATGDSGTGMTNGTIAGLMLAERVQGRGTPWDQLYDPGRIYPKGAPLAEWVKENLRNAGQNVKMALGPAEVESLAEIAPGEGAILRAGLKKVAVARMQDGRVLACSAMCTHLGCEVAWNGSERSWDCPCHGSRFAPDGSILHGPAKDPLAPVDLEKLVDREKAARGLSAK